MKRHVVNLAIMLSYGTLVVGCTKQNTLSGRPTAGWLTDTTAASSVGKYEFKIKGTRPLNLLQTIGNGCGVADFNLDGNLDLILVGNPVAVYIGDGKGAFTAVPCPALSGLPAQGCAIADIDNDGDPDVYLSGYKTGYLWRNDKGKLTDITASSKLPKQPWGTSASFTDLDHDGLLDLVIANYVQYDPAKGTRTLCDFRDSNGKTVLGACGPREYLPLQASIHHNLGKCTFADITKSTKVITNGRGLGVASCDTLANGSLRIAIGNDETPGDLLAISSQKPIQAINYGARSGTAYDLDGKLHGGMGVDFGDYDNDGKFDLAVATFEGEPMSLYHNDGSDLYTDRSVSTNVAFPTRPLVTFGLHFIDVDNDSWLDIVTTNGHVLDNVTDIKEASVYRQSSQILRNTGKGRFEDISQSAGAAFVVPMVGRGLAAGDIDNDGRVDLIVIDSEGHPHVYKNGYPNSGNWIGLQLQGTLSPRDGTGAIVTITQGKTAYIRHAHSDGSYMSASDARVNVGLGENSSPVDISVRWSSGIVQKLSTVNVGHYTRIIEPAR